MATIPVDARRWPKTFWLGLFLLVGCEVLLFSDVYLSRRTALHDELEIRELLAQRPENVYHVCARFVAVNMTALVWPAFVLLLEGVLARQAGGSPIRRRPHHFTLLAIASILIWCLFDAINFAGGMRAWEYIGMPPRFWQRFPGYVLAFACIVPGMLLVGQVLLNTGIFDWARSPAWTMPRWAKGVSLVVGVGMFLWPMLHRSPVTNLTLWTSLVFLLDPLNLALGRPSMFRDWQNGWYGRTLAAFAGGLICGLLWEFWNYWALAKWVYHLPFLGSWESVRYFEMPVPGLLGFIPFGIECWVIWQLMRIPFDGLAEPLPGEKYLL